MPNNDISVFLSEDPKGIRCVDLVSMVRTKKLALADIQRDSVWDSKASKQLDLFRSMYIGIPIGVLYVWEPTIAHDLLRSRHLDGLEDFYQKDSVTHLILDGQQRTTTICRLHLSKRPSQNHLMDRVVLDLSKDARMNKVFRFEKDNSYIPNPHEVIIQDLLQNEGLTHETQRIQGSDLSSDEKLSYISQLNKVITAFTTRKIAVQYVNSNATLQDALRIFSTVNQAGVALADPDFIQALFTSIWPQFHNKIHGLVESLQYIQTGVDNAGNPVSSKLGGFKRDVILKTILWQLFGTTKRKALIVDENLDIYNPRELEHSLTMDWKDMTMRQKQEATIPLTRDRLEAMFVKIEMAARAFKKNLTDELFFDSNTGHSDNSILGGIIFHMNHQTPTDYDLGKLLVWYILSSYHKEWTGGSTDVKVDYTCKCFSHENGVQWQNLWKQMQINSQIDKKQEFSGIVSDLYPKISVNGFPGPQSGTTGKASGIIIQLIEKSLPFSLRMRDWFTGEKLWNMEHKQFSTHHIFPQSRFKLNRFTRTLIELDINYSDIEINHSILIEKLQSIYQTLKIEVDKAQAEVDSLTEDIDEMKEIISALKDSDAEANLEEIERVTKNRAKLMKRRQKKSSKMHDLRNENQLYNNSIQQFDSTNNDELKTLALRNSCEFWFSYSKKRLIAMEHPANKISIKLKSNSSIGNRWPQSYLQTLLAHEKRISKQFMKLNDMSLFTPQKFREFIHERTKWQHAGLTSFLDSLLEGSWGEVEVEPPISDEEILTREVEIGIERKESMYFDTIREKSTWDILKSAGKPVHYLRSEVERAIIAFGNSGGGYVVLGVADDGTVVGMDRDIQLLRNKYTCSVAEAKDKITTTLSNQISNSNQEFCHRSVEQRWINYQNKPVLLIKVRGFHKVVKHNKYPKTGVTEEGTVILKRMMKNVHWIRTDGGSAECSYQ